MLPVGFKRSSVRTRKLQCLVCGGNHTNDQPWILDGVLDVSARSGTHLWYRGSIIRRHKKMFSSLRL
jgi:hypothetical protein